MFHDNMLWRTPLSLCDLDPFFQGEEEQILKQPERNVSFINFCKAGRAFYTFEILKSKD